MTPVFPPNIIDLMPWDTIQNYVNDFTKKLQEKADDWLHPDDDNQHRTFVPHSWINTLACTRFQVNQLTTAYNDWLHSYGNQTYMYTCNIKIENNVATISSWTNVGKCAEGSWSNFNAQQREEIDELAANFDFSSNIRFVDNFPSEFLELQLDYYDAYSQRLAISDVGRAPSDSFYMSVHDVNGDNNYTPIKLWFYAQEFTTTEIQPMGEFIDMVGRSIFDQHKLVNGIFDCPYQQPMIWCTSDEDTVQKYVTSNGSDHNYTTTYNTGDGDEFKVYYGDNYVIYVVPDGDEVSYDDIYNVTKNVVVPQIDPTIHVPTYNENKYGPQPDYDDDNFGLTTTGFQSDIGGNGKYWLLDSPPDGLLQDFNLNAPEGSMFSQNILSCYCSALNWDWETSDMNIVLYTNGSKKPAYISTNKFPLIYQWNPHLIAGAIDVPRCTNTFYDFSPYSTYEVYVPFCGWVGLPDTVVGRKIRVYMDFDVATMSCKAIIMVEMHDESGDTIIGEITGMFGAPCPIQVTEGGLYRQAIVNSGLQIAGGVAQGVVGGMSGAKALVASGAINALQGLQNCHVAGNTNYSQTIGRAGDSSSLCGGHYCYLRVTHPVVDKVVETETFGHTIGYICNEVGELGDYSGFTVCLNPHIHIECTQSEKDEIKRLLESGVIL